MKDPRLIRTYKTTTVFGLILLLLGFALLAAPSDRIQTAAHSKSQGALGESNSYASLSLEQISELKNLSQQLADGQPFSAEEKIILRRFVAGEQISELEGDVVIKRVLFNYFVANGYLNAEDLALLKKYNAYCLSERRFNEDARLQAKRENSERQNATQPEPGLQPAAIPANDTCAGAISIVDTGTYPITTLTVDAVDATTTGDPTFCAAVSGLDDTIWYTFVPAVTGTYNITTCPTVAPGTSTSDTILGIFTSSGSCGGPFTSVDCNDDDIDCNNNASTISPILTAGLTYYIVAGRSTFLVEPSSVPIQLAISRVPAPANDTCASATPLTLNTPAIGQATAAANNDYQLSGTTCFTALGDNSIGNTNSTAVGRDVAYSFTAPSAGSYSFRISKFGNTLDPVLYLTTSCPSGPAPITVTCSNTTGPAIAAAHRVNGTGAQEIPCVSLSSGQTVYLIVDEASITVGSSAFTVEVNSCTQETEPNDTPATAGTGTEGVISSSSDVDFYQLGAPSAGSRVFAMVDGLAANSTDFDMRVTTSTDTLEFDSQDADSQFGSLSPVISGTLLTGVNSFLRISHGAATTATGPYRLYSKIQPGGTSDTPNCGGTQSSATAESEPNNTSAQANSAGNNYFYGTIPTPAPATDVDYYSFTANTGDLIFLGLDGDPCLGSAMNAALDLRDSADALLIGVNDGNGTNCGASCTPTAGNLAATTPAAPGEALVFRARYTGTYYAKVYTGVSTTVGTGDYLLSISVINGSVPVTRSISGTVVDSGSAPLSGVTMTLSGDQSAMTTTAGNGTYSFSNLANNGSYTVTPAKVSYTFAPPSTSFPNLASDQVANFTGTATPTPTPTPTPTATPTPTPTPTPFVISGQVTEYNGTPVSGVTMTFTIDQMGTIFTSTTQTDVNGNYSSGNLPCGNSNKVEPSKPGLVFSPTSISFVNTCASQTANFLVVPPVVISQIYTSGGEAGAVYKNDYIELFNRGGVSINLTGWSVQYTSATGTTWQLTNLTGVTLLPGQHYLVREASAGANGTDLPTPDAVGGISMSSAGGKVALISNNILVVGGAPCPLTPNVVDLVGYGPSTNCFEGFNPAPLTSTTTADIRQGSGCVDTNDNGADFTTGTPNAHNTASPLNACSSTVQFNSVSAPVTETLDATTKLDIAVTRGGDTSAAARVDYSSSDVTASERSDYLAALGTLRFAAGETTKVITVFIVDDRYAEGPETFNINLSNPIGCALGTQTTFTVTINSNEMTDGLNPVKDASFNSDFFVREHYVDFFNREADPSGLAFWKNQIDECTTQACREIRRINVSAAFFVSIEFQETGYLVYKAYQAAFNSGEFLKLRNFLPDTQEIGRGVVIGQPGSDAQLEANKQRFFADFVVRESFLAAYPNSLSAAQFVDNLNANTYDPQNPGSGGALTQSERDDLVAQLTDPASPTLRAQVLRAVAENGVFNTRQFNKAFVLMQYFGYLRRNPNDPPEAGLDFAGYNFWLGKLNQFNGNFVNAEMVKAFITSGEYEQRFGP